MPQVRWPVAGQVMGWIEMLDEERMLTGLLCSILLHGAFVALFILLRGTVPEPRPIPAPAVVQADLVPLAETGVSPPTSQKGLVPQQRAAEKAKQDGTGIPRPNDKIAEAAQDYADQAAQRTPHGRESGSKHNKPKPSGDSAGAPAANLQARLEAFARLREPPSRERPDPREQQGPGTSNTLTADAKSPRGATAAYGVKDFIRAQIQRRWYLNRAIPLSDTWTVALRLSIATDGTISSAEVVDDQHPDNKDYEEFAQSIRNAALLSSPLQLLPGSYDLVKDVTVTFTPHDARQ